MYPSQGRPFFTPCVRARDLSPKSGARGPTRKPPRVPSEHETANDELTRRIGRRRHGEVYRARAAGPMGFEKTLASSASCRTSRRTRSSWRCSSEAKLAAQLNHPNIIHIFDFGEAEGAYYIAMEYIDGPNLRALMRRAQSLPGRCRCRCARRSSRPRARGSPTRTSSGSADGRAAAPDPPGRQPGQHPAGAQRHREAGGLRHRQGGQPGPADARRHVKGKVPFSPSSCAASRSITASMCTRWAWCSTSWSPGRKPLRVPACSRVHAILYEPCAGGQPEAERPPPCSASSRARWPRIAEQRYGSCRALQADLEDFILSAGRTVGAYQLAQFIAQLFPLRRPDGLPRERLRRAQGSRRPLHGILADGAGEDAQGLPLPVKSLPLPPAEQQRSSPLPCHAAKTGLPASASRPAASKRSLTWLPGLIGVALLMAGGGYITKARTSLRPPPLPRRPCSPSPLLRAWRWRRLPARPGTPSGALPPLENPMPPALAPPWSLWSRSRSPQETPPRTERSANRRSSSQPGRSSQARAQPGDRQTGAARKPSTKDADTEILGQIEASGTAGDAR